MSFDANDPKLTAYALGELDDAERQEVEKLLESSPEARAAVADIRRTAELLTRELAAEPGAALTSQQREAIEQGEATAAKPIRLRQRRWVPYAVAASILILIGVPLGSLMLPSLSRAREVSRRRSEIPQAPAQGLRGHGTGMAIWADGDGDGEGWHGNWDFSVVEGSVDGQGGPGDRTLYYVEVEPGDAWDIASELSDEVELSARVDNFNTEAYDRVVDNPFLLVSQNPLSTFSIDVDTASYANIRRFLNSGQLPPPGAVRIEEMVNYFDYEYPLPEDEHPFSVSVEIGECPWTPVHRLMRVGLKGMEFEQEERPVCNLVFLIDVSGSMEPANKLPLLREALGLLVDQLYEDDRVGIVVYASASGLVLPSTTGDNPDTILHAIANLEAGGSTNAGEGIQLAYDIAADNFIEGGVNRVILATDGDFNVGITNQSDLIRLIEEKAASDVFLSVLGVGMGNYKDSTLEKLADKGNGNYAYIDTLNEAQKVLVDQIGGTLVTIAKDVKIQIEFNPAEVAAYRLIGYENRILADQDFNDDTKDAGEIGAGHTVTALYELVPPGIEIEIPGVDPLKYQSQPPVSDAAASGETATVKLRYKHPDGDTSILLEVPIADGGASLVESSEDFRFAASVASFGMLLRDSPYRADWSFGAALKLASESLADDSHGYRAEFVELVERAEELTEE